MAKQAPTPPSIPQATRPMAAAPPPPAARPAAPPAYGSPMGHQAPHAPPPAMAPPAAAPMMPQGGGGGGMLSGGFSRSSCAASACLQRSWRARVLCASDAALPAGLMGSVVTGMAMGTGSAVAHRAVDSMMGPRQVEHVHTGAPAAAPASHGTMLRVAMHGSLAAGQCAMVHSARELADVCQRARSNAGAPAPMQCMNETQLFQECVKNTGGDTAPCQAYLDMMMKCKARKPPLLPTHVHDVPQCVSCVCFPCDSRRSTLSRRGKASCQVQGLRQALGLHLRKIFSASQREVRQLAI